MVINVPEGPLTGEIDVTEPIVHEVNKKSSWFVGTVWLHEVGLMSELETHDDAGIDAKVQERNSIEYIFADEYFVRNISNIPVGVQ